MTFCYTSGILLFVTNVYDILETNAVFRKIHQIFPVAGLFFLLSNCWQPAAGTDVHFFQLQLALMQSVRFQSTISY